jgi:hypothetical protein
VVDPGRVQGGHAPVDPLAAEEVAVVVEEQLVVVDVGVVEGHPQRPRLGLERARGEGGDVEATAPEGGVDARRQVVAGADHRPEVGHVQPERRQVALPADDVQRMVREGEGGDLAPAPHPDPEAAPLVVRVGLGRLQHPRVEQGVVAEQPLVGQDELVPLDEQEEVVGGLRDDPVGGALGHDQVVPGPEPQRAVVGLQGPLAPVDEVDDVAVGVADEERHRLRAARHQHGQVLVGQHHQRVALGVGLVGRGQLVPVEGPGAQRALDLDPGGRRGGPVQVRGPAGERLAAVLLLDGALGQVDVGLPGGQALALRDHPLAPFGARLLRWAA